MPTSLDLDIHAFDHGVRFSVKVVPGGSRDEIVGMLGRAIKIKVSAPPEGGKANKAVCGLIAKILGVAKRDVRVESGQSRPGKLIAVDGADVEDVIAAMGAVIRRQD